MIFSARVHRYSKHIDYLVQCTCLELHAIIYGNDKLLYFIDNIVSLVILCCVVTYKYKYTFYFYFHRCFTGTFPILVLLSVLRVWEHNTSLYCVCTMTGKSPVMYLCVRDIDFYLFLRFLHYIWVFFVFLLCLVWRIN